MRIAALLNSPPCTCVSGKRNCHRRQETIFSQSFNSSGHRLLVIMKLVKIKQKSKRKELVPILVVILYYYYYHK